MKLIAIVFSDLHINLWNKFNECNKRTLDNFRVLSVIKEICKANGNIPALFCGDLFHKPENLENDLFEIVEDEFSKLDISGFKCYAISGNHDMSKSNSLSKPSPSWVKTFSHYNRWLKCIDFKSEWLVPNIRIIGVPYIDHNIGLSEYIKDLSIDSKEVNILMLHTDYPGAKDTDGREIGSVENLNINILNKFDLVLCGHIHKPQRLSKKVYMIGAPLQQRRTDRDSKLGYWELYSDLSMKFKELKDFPKFIDVESEDEIKYDGNYYTVIPKKEESINKSTTKIHRNLSKSKLARQYLREKGIKDKDKSDLLKRILKEADDDKL